MVDPLHVFFYMHNVYKQTAPDFWLKLTHKLSRIVSLKFALSTNK